MSTAKSKYIRDLADLREKLDRALNNNERDQTVRDKILNDAKVEILTLSKKVSFAQTNSQYISSSILTVDVPLCLCIISVTPVYYQCYACVLSVLCLCVTSVMLVYYQCYACVLPVICLCVISDMPVCYQ